MARCEIGAPSLFCCWSGGGRAASTARILLIFKQYITLESQKRKVAAHDAGPSIDAKCRRYADPMKERRHRAGPFPEGRLEEED
jgi:hypothetical protein